MKEHEIIVGEARKVLSDLPPHSVQCCITSPPYWGLRDYGVPPVTWSDCWIGSLGLEPTPEQYVVHVVEVMRKVRRVLKPEGTLWLNLGDCYIADGGEGGRQGARGERANRRHTQSNLGVRVASKLKVSVSRLNGGDRNQAYTLRADEAGRQSHHLKSKDLVGIPWRVAFALQADGWWLRSDIIWNKPNPMPESVRDRPTKAHEYLFLLSKSEVYFYDAVAIMEPTTGKAHPRGSGVNPKACTGKNELSGDRRLEGFNTRWRVKQNESFARSTAGLVQYRNKRSVWKIATRPFKGAHFATFPTDLVEPCILAGSRAGDVVLDPFAGTGTVGLAALKHGRSFLGIELNPQYVIMAENRIRQMPPVQLHIKSIKEALG
jgi:DNA modification methylase